ncbi:SDR family NAD(P)-dependent oxidoreductase [Actinomadura fibrosa]|uniref:SDR family NAD(P)-dependent oxidoreductase n=1 Tax=Actinomadura fibrosa TaxID=111802 RepID=A0ABW2XSY3_9ACTN|nr:SDR family oxidoreductase [Actinomadura fibrosa]
MGRAEGKVVVVTGGARGQGRAAAEHLAREGAHVWIADVLDTDTTWSGPGSLTHHRLDVTSESAWRSLRDALQAEHGRLDGLVNNAGVAARDRLPDVGLTQWRRVLDINVTGPLLGMQTLFPLMRPGGSIVNIVSVAGMSGHAAAPYTTSKWALRGLTRSASLEYGELGIRVNAVFPGLIDTPLMADASPAFRNVAIGETPLGRIGVPEDVAPLIVYLISDESSYVNGAEITVDGGLTAHVSHKSIADATRPAPKRH